MVVGKKTKLFAVVALTSVSSFLTLSKADSISLLADSTSETSSNVDYGFDVNAGEPDDFKITSLSSNSTDTSHALSLRIASSTPYLYSNTTLYKNIFVSSNDTDCPNDKATSELTTKYDFDPTDESTYSLIATDEEGNYLTNEDGTYQFAQDKDGNDHSYKANLPSYEGYIYKIEPAEKRETLAIPYVVNRFDRYEIVINSISSNLFGFKTLSDSSTSDLLRKVNSLVIGPNITRIEANAFEVTEAHKSQLNLYFIGSESSISFAENWTNIDTANIHFDCSIDDLPCTDAEKTELKQIYNTEVEKDADGNINYYDSLGYRVDEEGNYLDDTTKDPYEGIPQTKRGALVLSFKMASSKSSSKTFFFGSQESNRPMVLEYQVKKTDDTVETRYYEFPFNESDLGVGNGFGKPELNLTVEFHINKGEKVVDDSFVVRNIFESKTGELTADPELEYSFRAIRGYSENFNLSDFINVHDYKVKTFGGYTAFTLTVDKVFGIYEKVNPVVWNTYHEKVESGEMEIRYSFVNFSNASYRITFIKNGELTTKDVTFPESSSSGVPLTFHLLTKDSGNKVTFLLNNSLIDEDFNVDSVRRVEYKGVSFKLSLMSTKRGTTQVVTKSDVITTFGLLDILPEHSEEPSSFSGVTFMIVGGIAYLAIFVTFTFVYYKVAKNAYKNDEFRRIDDKKYFKKMAKYSIEGLLVYLGVFFSILRFGFFNTSVIVYNPVDPFVIVFDVIAIVVIGIFIKNFVAFSKANKARKEAIRLKLNEDVIEDGTN